MPVGFSFGPKPGSLRRRPPLTPPPTGEIRWISPTGTGNGQSVSTPAPLSQLATMITQAGPGGQVRIRADQGEYTGAGGISIASGGTAQAPVVIYGSDGSGNPMKATIRGSRTSPWPSGSVGANAGSNFITLNSGANFLNFRGLHLRDMKIAFLTRGNITGLTLGNPAYRDTAVSALVPADGYIDWDAVGYQALVDQIFAASAAGVSSVIQAHAVDMTNIYRGLDCGVGGETTESLYQMAVYGGTYRGTARGWYRIRGGGEGYWFQDMDMDGGGLAYVSEDANWAVGIEMNDSSNLPVGASGAVFLRCIANNHRCSDRSLGYTNGDGFSGERRNERHMYIRCQADGNEDGGIETKATKVTIIGGKFEANRRNFRLWGSAEAHKIDLRNPTSTGRNGGGANQVFSQDTAYMVRIVSGTLSSSDGAGVFETNGTHGFIAVSTDVVVTRGAGSSLYVAGHSIGYCGSYSPTDQTVPTITSSGTRSVAEGTADNYTPTVSVPHVVTGWSGPDAGQVSRNNRTLTLGAKFRNTPLDANGDSVYVYTVEVMAANRKKATQTVQVSVGGATPAGLTILSRMSAAGSAPSSGRTTIYQAMIDVLEDQGVGLKTQNLLFGKVHSNAAARLGWIGSDLAQIGTQTMPTHTVDAGFSSNSPAVTAYWGDANDTFDKTTDAYFAIAAHVTEVPPRVNGLSVRGDVFGWGDCYISADSDGNAYVKVLGGNEITISGAFPGMVYADRSGTTVRAFRGTTLVTSQTTDTSGRSSVRPLIGMRDGGSSPMTGKIGMAWIGFPLTTAELSAFVGGVSTMFTAIGNNVSNPPPTVASDPLVAILGASRFRQGYNSPGVNVIDTHACGQFEWAKALGANFRLLSWYADTDINSFGMNGFVFAADGNTFATFRSRVPKLMATAADVVIINAATYGIQFGATVDSFCNEFKELIQMIWPTKAVIIDQLWERGSSAGGPWGVGQAPRALVAGINAEMASWCGQRGIPVIPCRDVLVDTAGTYTPNREPLPGMTRGDTTVSGDLQTGDTTHLSNLGGWTYGKKAAEVLLAVLPPAAPVPAADAAGNFVTNPLMTGTSGTKTNVTGNVANNYTVFRTGTSVTVTAAKVDKAPSNTRFGSATKTWQQLTISNTSALTGTTREGWEIQTTITGLTVGKWYEPRVKVEVDAGASNGGCVAYVRDSQSSRSRMLYLVDDGGSVGQGFWSTRMQRPHTEGYGAMYVGMPFQAVQTSATMAALGGAVSGSSADVVIRVTDFEFREVADPNIYMTGGSVNTDPVTITSPNAFSTVEGAAFSTTVVTSEPCSFALSGADAAIFSIDSFGVLSGGPFNYGIPQDAGADNVYNLTITATPFNTAKTAATQAVTVTVTELAAGFTDNFTGADGTDIADNNSGWTRVGAAGGLVISGNACLNVQANGNTPYLAPDTGQRNNWVTITAQTTGQKPHVVIPYQDALNFVRFQLLATPTITVTINDVTTTTTLTRYKTHAAADVYDVILYNDVVYAYQNQVKMGQVSIAGLMPGARRVGLRSTFSSGSANTVDNFQSRPYNGGYVEKVALAALTMSPLTSAASSPYAGALSGRTVGSAITLGTITPSAGAAAGDWIADGDFIRATGVTAGATYTVPVIETFAGAANSPRTTTFNVAFT